MLVEVALHAEVARIGNLQIKIAGVHIPHDAHPLRTNAQRRVRPQVDALADSRIERLDLDRVADDVEHAQGLVPGDALDTTDQLARSQTNEILGGAGRGLGQLHRQCVVGQMPPLADGCGFLQAHVAHLSTPSVAHEGGDGIRALGRLHGEAALAELEDLQLIGQLAQAHRVHSRAADPQAVRVECEHLKIARIESRTHGKRLGLHQLDRTLGDVGAVVGRHRHRALGARRTRLELQIVLGRDKGCNGLAVAHQLQCGTGLHHGQHRCQQGHLGDVHETLAVLGSTHLVKHQLVVTIGHRVVEIDRAHIATAAVEARVARGHLCPARIVPAKLRVGTIKRELGGIPLRNVVIGTRRQLQGLDHLGRRQIHDQSTARTVKIEVLGAVAAVKGQVHAFVGGTVERGRRARQHSDALEIGACRLTCHDGARIGLQVQAQTTGVGIGQHGRHQMQVGGLAACELNARRQIHCGRCCRCGWQEGVERPVGGRGHHMTGLGVKVAAAPIQPSLYAHVATAGHALPVEAAIARQPHATVATVGGGHQGRGIVTHPHRSPGLGQTQRSPLPAVGRGIGQVDVATRLGHHHALARKIHVGGNPVAIVLDATGLIGPGDGPVGRHLAHVEAAIDRPVGFGTHGRQDGRSVVAERERTPIGIGCGLLNPAVLGGVIDPQFGRRVALPPVKDVVEVPLARCQVAGQHPAVVQHQRLAVVVRRSLLAHGPAQARIVGQGQVTAERESGDASAVVCDRHRVKAHALGQLGRRPGLALVT